MRTRMFLAALVGAAFMLTGCGSSTVAYPTPASYVVYDGATCYAGYQYDPLELQMYTGIPTGCTPVAFPSVSFVPVPGTLAFMLARQLTTYDTFYHSGYWYDQYYAPLAPRYHVTLAVQRRQFDTNASTFRTTYAPQIKDNSAKATYLDAKGKRTTGAYKFPTSNNKAANKPITNAGNKTTTTNSKPLSGSAYTKPVTNTAPRSSGRR